MSDSSENVEHRLSQIDKIIKEEEAAKSAITDHLNSSNVLLFDKIFNYIPFGLLTSSILLGAFFFLLHYSIAYVVAKAFPVAPFEDFSWFISILISVNCYTVVDASKRLKTFIVSLVALTDFSFSKYQDTYLPKLRKISTELPVYGVFFGIMNVLFGFTFGIWYESKILLASLILQIFLIGLLAGMAFGGIVGVVRLVKFVSENEKLRLDFDSSDGCAGTLSIGTILFYFSFYTLVMAILIATYIIGSPWVNVNGNLSYSILIDSAYYLWIVFPFLVSIIIFVSPVFSMHTLLLDYKFTERKRLDKRLSAINNLIMEMDPQRKDSATMFKNLSDYSRFLENLRSKLLKTRVWPYNFNYEATYVVSLAIPVMSFILSELGEKIDIF